MTYDEDTGQWTDGPSITRADLPIDEDVFRMYWDGEEWPPPFRYGIGALLVGMKFARDITGNVYLYFKTHRRRDPWPDRTFAAKLWIFAFTGSDMHSYKVYLTLDDIYGTHTTLHNNHFEDRSLGHLAFDLYSKHVC